MDCHLFEILVQRYYDGELDPVAISEYERHRQGCEACRAFDAEYAAVFGALGDIPRFEPSEGFDAAVMSKVDVSRYRVSVARRSAHLFGSAWNRMPAPVRVGSTLAAVFALFITVYRPLLQLLIDMARGTATFIGSMLLLTRELPDMLSETMQGLGALESYRIAGETLLNALRRVASALPLTYILIPIIVIALLPVLMRITRAIAKKGETHAGII